MNEVLFSSIPIEDFKNLIVSAVKEVVLAERVKEPVEADLLTRKEAAKLLGISLPTLHTYTLKGMVIGYRLGHNVRYKKAELEAALNSIKTLRK